jgi:hypothetical protein
MCLLLFLGAALAQDTAEPEVRATIIPEGSAFTLPDETREGVSGPSLLTLSRPPSLAEGINMVPEGSVVLLRQEDGTFRSRLVPAKAFLLPEPMYDKALVQAKQLKICQPALDSITEEMLRMADRNYEVLSKCGGQFDSDEVLINDLTGQVRDWETRALVAEDRLKSAHRRTAVAWAITGGLVLGATSAIVVSVAN